MEKEMQRVYESGIMHITMIDMASIAGKQANEQKGKKERKQTKCDVRSFIVLKHGWHTSKQDSCMDMKASV